MTRGGWHHDNANWKPKTCAVCGTEQVCADGEAVDLRAKTGRGVPDKCFGRQDCCWRPLYA